MDARVLYMSRFYVAPEGKQAVFAWLDGGHNAEVARYPGFVFCKRVKLEQKSEDGWEGYVMLYGVESREALQRYFDDRETAARFTREREPFNKYLRMERFWGTVDLSI